MKSLEEALKGRYCHVNKAWDCGNCPYLDMDACADNMSDDLYLNAIKLKEENKRLKYFKNIYEETMVFFSDANMELLGDMKALKEENNKLKEENRKLKEETKR